MSDRPSIADLLPLSPLQRAVLLHTLRAERASSYQTQVVNRLRGTLDTDAFAAAYGLVVARHPALRTGFLWEGVADPVQVVYRTADTAVELVDLTELTEAERNRRTADLVAADAARGFDVANPPLMRLTLLRESADAHLLVWTHLSLAHDGWSTMLLAADLERCYVALRDGRPVPPNDAPPPRDHLAWRASLHLTGSLDYWRDRLAGIGAATPVPGAGGVGRPDDGVGVCSATAAVTDARLRAAARRRSVTPSVLVQSAWAAVLGRWTGGSDVVFGLVVAGRSAPVPGIEKMIGQLVNTVPVRVTPRPGEALDALLRRMQHDHTLGLRHGHVPFGDVQRAAAVPGEELVTSVLAFQNHLRAGEPARTDLGYTSELVEVHETTQFPVTVFVVPEPHATTVKVTYHRAHLTAPAAALLAEALACALVDVAEGTPATLDDVALGGAAAIGRADTTGPGELVTAAFAAQVARAPDAPAIVGEPALTYRELDEQSDRLAARLRAAGAAPDEPVALLLHRSARFVVAALAVLKAGGAWLPIDPAYPAERIAMLVADAHCRLVVTDSTMDSGPDLPGATVVDLARPSGGDVPPSAPPVRPHPDNAAYVIYTSGSTGRPKGVVVSHRSAMNTVRWMEREFGLGPGQVFAMKTSVGFTDSVAEMVGALCTGAALAIVAAEAVRDPAALRAAFVAHDVSHAVWVPRALEGFLDAAQRDGVPRRMRWALNGGEPLPPALVTRWEATMPPEARIANPYGMTEAAVYSTNHTPARGAAGATGRVPIGQPIPGTSVHVLDRTLRPCPPGVVGEIYLGGVGLARGYLGRPGLTAERFVPDPAGAGRLYRTGDLGRWDDGGLLECLGRSDHQLKIRGARVEPAEVESAIGTHPGVRDVVVVGFAGSDGTRLAAYVRPQAGVTADDIRRHATERLPAHLRPAVYVLLDELPLSAHGKVDRSRLPRPEVSVAQREFTPPRTDVEIRCAQIWSDVLGTPRVGLTDDFFDLGGDSLLAVRAVGYMRDSAGLEVTIRDLFDHGTIDGCLAAVDERQLLEGLQGLSADELGALLDQAGEDARA